VVFARVRYCDRSLHLAKLFSSVDLGPDSSSDGDPGAAIQRSNEFDARVAVTLYAGIADVPGVARRVSRSERTSIPCGGGCRSGVFPKGTLPRRARVCGPERKSTLAY
jgi:hypothetical protein